MSIVEQAILILIVAGFIFYMAVLMFGWIYTRGWEPRATEAKTAPQETDQPEDLRKAA